ncbi:MULTISPECIES: hypothetical protein [Paenarthrobacter]|uniref:hypothetical protein n=1 Tax=Paenarthrobacter TaxID=1742992 RepID=UPI00236500AA|nr:MULTISPECIES: hypothetical protein [Paenarthrobacter]MDD7835114.1 hypothetical protein [Paenarthrobacter sp. AB444]MDP9936602.1 hypothetical protein [Paenarthrobacter nicotinovorans]
MEESTVFVMSDPENLPVRYYKAWEYFVTGDEVEVRQPGAALDAGVVVNVMPDGSGVWVYVNGVGQRLFCVEEDVAITIRNATERADTTLTGSQKRNP